MVISLKVTNGKSASRYKFSFAIVDTKVNTHDSVRKVVNCNIAAKAFSVVAVHTIGVLNCYSA